MPAPIVNIGWGDAPWTVLPWGQPWDYAALALIRPFIFRENGMPGTLRKTKGDTMDSVIAVRDVSNRPIDLTRATEIRFQMQSRIDEDLKRDDTFDPADIVFDAVNGLFVLAWDTNDVDEVGQFWAELEIEFGASDTLKLPNIGKNFVIIQEELHVPVP